MPKQNRREFLIQSTATFSTLSVLPSIAFGKDTDAEVDKPFRPWTEGTLDLHFFYTGAGENMFYVFPDGTTMLLDASDRPSDQKDQMPYLPDETHLPSEWFARYIRRVSPSPEKIDYMMLSHFHDDHAGGEKLHAGKTVGRGDDYCLSGLANLGEIFAFDKVFDRKYPDYAFAETEPKSDGFAEFHKFTEWKLKNGEIKMEPFDVGRLDQITLKKNREKYPDFHIRNLCANAIVWNRQTGELIDFYGLNPKNHRLENLMSLGILVAFGPFRYYTGGDVAGAAVDENGRDLQIEGAVGKASGPVDVCKTNHHSYKDGMRPEFVREVKARVYVTNVWDCGHLQDETMSAMCDTALYEGDRLVCPTWAPPKRMEEFRDKPWQKYLKPAYGHVVVRVTDGGKKYTVYHLTADNESMTVKAVFGPFDSTEKPFPA